MRLVSSVVALFVAHGASAAVWTGGASGTLDDAANWDGDITASTMVFTNDCTLTLSADATVYQPLTDGNGTDVPNGPIKNNAYNRAITFDLNGHSLTANYNGTQYWRNLGTSATFTGGGTFSVMSGSTTNAIIADNGGHYGMSLTFTGEGTRFVGSWANRLTTTDKKGARLLLLNGAEAEGCYFNFGGFNSTNEVSGGSRLRYHAPSDSAANGFCVGGQINSPQNGGVADVLKISGIGTVVEPVATSKTGGLFKVGYGGIGTNNRGNRLIVENGAKLVLPGLTSIGDGGVNDNGEYHSDDNELIVTGEGSTIINERSNSDYPNAVGRRGSFNRLLIDNGAFAKLKGVSSGGEMKSQLGNNVNNRISSYLSAYNLVKVDNASTLDASVVYVGNQHTDYKQRVAQYRGQCYSNRVDILGGSTLYATNGNTVVGAIAPYFGNVLSVSGAGTKAKFGNTQYSVMVGQAGSCSNRFEVLDGAKVELDGSLFVAIGVGSAEWGYAPDGTTIVRGIGNMARIEGAGSSVTGLQSSRSIALGSQTNGNANVLWVGDGATLTWPGTLTIEGFDNSVVVSNGTFNLAQNLRSVWIDAHTMEVSGRTRFVFAGAAPKLVAAGIGISKFMNEAVLRFEVPAAGWAEAPLQITGTSNNVVFNDDTNLEVDVAEFRKAGGGEIPIITTGRALTISSGLLQAWNTSLAAENVKVKISDDKKTLSLKVMPIGFVLIVR
jgi:hypothetical protein